MEITREHFNKMVQHARVCEPRECCGLLVGRGDVVDEVRWARNEAVEANRFAMNQQDQYEIVVSAGEEGRRVLGVYHSHLDGSTTPSGEDVPVAYDPHILYLIVGVHPEPYATAWQIQHGVVARADLQIKTRRWWWPF